ncbi:MAG TPA: phosphogluconate dehydratase [Caulobacteraceae bacterium]|nr:phosphogluconate dehydratase [Caulobacteraceae bacterium]
MQSVVEAVTTRVVERSRQARADYVAAMREAVRRSPGRGKLSCANFAHAFASAPGADKLRALDPRTINVGVVTAYNDMLSAHQPYERFPELIRSAARGVGATAQVAGGVPAMCDGVTQGRPGMELSLFSRDVIALSTAIALSHDAFDAALCLGICDKIVPGLLIGALRFGHLPVLFVPSGPMSSGLSNAEKAKTRALYAEGKLGRDELLKSEMASYHGPGTCTFYGTANSNQMMMEMMGLHLPGAAFVPPNSPLRDALTAAAVRRAVETAFDTEDYTPLWRVVDERSVINAAAGLLATGGSTNHTLHLLAMARAAGVIFTWEDFDDLANVTPLIARVYPNGSQDVNAFHAAGGMAFVVRELVAAGLAHENVATVAGPGLSRYTQEPFLEDAQLAWRPGRNAPLDDSILRPVSDPFDSHGGIRVLTGGLGKAVAKISAVPPLARTVEAPAVVFNDQDELIAAFERGELDRDLVAIVRFQGPMANGMPELHSLSPTLGVLMDRGFKVALVTDGRMSGASGKVLAALHVTPEAGADGPLAYVNTGDVICVDAAKGRIDVRVDPAVLRARSPATAPAQVPGHGRELFAHMRSSVGSADTGACTLF